MKMSLFSPVLAMFSSMDVLLIGLIVFLMFGPKKLPELAKGMGQAMKEFKKAQSDVEDNFRTAVQDDERKKQEEERKKAIAAALDEERKRVAAEEERKRTSASISPQFTSAQPSQNHPPEKL